VRATPYYIIRGGIEGRERLRILSRVMQPTTLSSLRRVGIAPRMACLEVGCGSGDMAFDMARMVAPEGRVLATNIDETKLFTIHGGHRSIRFDDRLSFK